MNVLILGSGLLGVTTAYELARRGAQVTVLERQSECAAETSRANGGQLSYSHAEPWASPAVLRKLPKWLLDPDAPLVFRFRADPEMIRFGLRFLGNCTTQKAAANCVNLLRLGLYSRRKMAELRADTGIQFDFSDQGVLHVYGTQKDFDAAKRQNDFQTNYGCTQRVLTREEAFAMEPVLAQTERPIVGGIHAACDEVGDPYVFCKVLSEYCEQKFGTKFLYGVSVQSLRTEGKKVVSVHTNKGDYTADAVVMACGSYSTPLLKPLGVKLPIYPMKGYSITIPATKDCPNISVTDGTYKVVYSRLGDRLRIAGTAEFAGYDTSLNERRVNAVERAGRTLFPGALWDQKLHQWACLRPSTPDGPPILGVTPYQNLYLNTGHGTLGWTQAAGSAAIVADIMEHKTPGIMLHGLTLERY